MKCNAMKCGVFLLGLLTAGVLQASEAILDNVTVQNSLTVYGQVNLQQASPGIIPTNGMVLYYNFNTSTTPVPDLSGLGRVGTVSGATWVTNGISGGAYSFNGVDNYINAGRISELEGMASYTVSFWAKMSNPAGMPIFFSYDVDDICGNDNTYTDAYCVWMNSSSVLKYGAATGSELNFSVMLADGAWHHIVVVRNYDTVSAYANGSFLASYSVGNSVLGGSTYKLRFGHPMNGNAFAGLMDEVIVYNRAISDVEVASIYSAVAQILPGAGSLSAITISASNRISQTSTSATNIFMGTVGIGTNSPATNATLHVAGNGRFDKGVSYVLNLGDMGMGVYTNKP